ncbi:MAG: metallophosphoesterase, partial [Muribaculaceae bacterium]|nr:metallophosphoesterase [Muribaculaceae bacterium]
MTQRSTTYFIADLHIGAKYITDPRDHERRVVDFLRSIKDDAKTLYLMGDVLDYWFEYKKVVPRGYIRFFGALAELADAGVEIIWFVGNHDIWLFDYLRDEIGLKVVDGVEIREIDGKR